MLRRFLVFGLIGAVLLSGCRGATGSGGLPPAPATNLPMVAPVQPTLAPGIAAGAKIEPASAQALAAAPALSLGGVTGLVWLPGGQSLALASAGGVALYTPAGPGALPQAAPRALAQPALPGESAVSPPGLLTTAGDAPILAWVGGQQAVFMWKEPAGVTPVATTAAPVTGLALSPDGARLAYVTYDKVLVNRTLGAVAQSAPVKAPAWLTNLVYSPDGTQIGGADLPNFRVFILDAQTGQTVRILEWVDSPAAALYGAYFSPDWSRVAWVSQSAVQVMDATTGRPGRLLSHADTVSALAWSQDGRLLATASAVKNGGDLTPAVILWNPTDGVQLAALSLSGPAQGLSFSPDGTRLAVLGADGGLQMWSVGGQ